MKRLFLLNSPLNQISRAHVRQLCVTARLEYLTALLNYASSLTAALPNVEKQSRDSVGTAPPARSPAKYEVPRHCESLCVVA